MVWNKLWNALREIDPSKKVDFDSPEFDNWKYKEKKRVTVYEDDEQIEYLTKEFNEHWHWLTAANRKTGAMLFPDRSKIERDELSPEKDDLKDR